MRKDTGWNKQVMIALALILASLASFFWAGPLAQDLPVNYSNVWSFDVQDQFRQSLDTAWAADRFTAQRNDQTLKVNQGTNLVQSALVWYNNAGESIFNSSNIYGVNARTRENAPEYGDAIRTGLFLPPAGAQPGSFTLWDSMFIGPRQASFVKRASLDGLDVLVFQVIASGLDETSGYSSLPDVPEHYKAHTDGSSKLWVEPISGWVVDYEERGRSYFVDANGRAAGDFHLWSDRFSTATRQEQTRQALVKKHLTLLFSSWLPLGLGGPGLMWLAILMVQRVRRWRGVRAP